MDVVNTRLTLSSLIAETQAEADECEHVLSRHIDIYFLSYVKIQFLIAHMCSLTICVNTPLPKYICRTQNCKVKINIKLVGIHENEDE